MGRRRSKEEKEQEEKLQKELQEKQDIKYMKEAVKQAKKAYALGEVRSDVSSYMKIRLSDGDTTAGRLIKIHWPTRSFRRSARRAGR